MKFDTASESAAPTDTPVVNIDPEVSSPWEAKLQCMEIARKIRNILQNLPMHNYTDAPV